MPRVESSREWRANPSAIQQVLVLVAFAALVRIAYLALTTAVTGDAMTPVHIAQSLANKDVHSIDRFWMSLYCFWVVPFYALTASPTWAAVLASCLPGTLLVVPTIMIARRLYSPRVAWLAGAAIACHPRLVEYSCNGYAESFYLLSLFGGLAFATWVISGAGWKHAVACGLFLGAYLCVRSEGCIICLAVLLILLLAHGERIKPVQRMRLQAMGLTAACLAGVMVMTGAYAATCFAALGTVGIFQKTSNLAKTATEQLDPEEAARQTYGVDGALMSKTVAPRPSPAMVVRTLASRYPRNIAYAARKLPGIMLTPLPLFALFLLKRRKWRPEHAQLPLVLVACFGLAFYPLIQLEPRLLFPLLIPLSIWGAAGFQWIFERQAGRSLPRTRLWRAAIAALLVCSIAGSLFRAAWLERHYSLHRRVAAWMTSAVDPSEIVAGDGYGFVSASAFLAQRQSRSRMWTNEPADLTRWLRESGSHTLILYEEFLRQHNPELLHVLRDGLPGAKRVATLQGRDGMEAQAFQIE